MFKKFSTILLVSILLFSLGILPTKFSHTENVQAETIQTYSVKKTSLQGTGGGSTSSPVYLANSAFKFYTAKQIEKKYKLKTGEYHNLVKGEILKEANKVYSKDMKRIGSNPDIHLSSDGTIQIVSRTKGVKPLPTNWKIQDFLP